MTVRLSPLDAVHRSLGARMVPFGGWEMPLSYDRGTLAEHLACRNEAVVFDVSHLGTVRVEGPAALPVLQRAFSNDLNRIGTGRAQYTHLLDESGGVVDDIIVWWLADDLFEVMPNASNTNRVTAALSDIHDGSAADLRMVDVTDGRALLAVQGPSARARVAQIIPEVADLPRFHVCEVNSSGVTLTIAGTGYTGEDGVEISVPRDRAEELWTALIDLGIPPAGLGARDTLRLEAGLPLHGHELGPEITPLQANLGWVVAWDKGEFTGRAALVAERERGVARRLHGLVTEGRRPPREGSMVMRDGVTVGQVTSGNFSPVLGHGIALALLASDVGEGDPLEVMVRESALRAQVVALPFVA